MKITLVSPHQVTKAEPIPLYGALGVLALAAAVRQRRHECEVVDLVRYGNISDQSLEKVADEIAESVLKTNPGIVGISAITDSLAIALELAKRIKKQSAHSCIVLGGPGVSYCSGDIVKNFPFVDFIIRGEADYAFPDFISAYENKITNPQIKGLVYIRDGQIVDLGWPDPVTDLDKLPVPAYDLCKNNEYETAWFDRNYGFLIEAGRGCPYNCIFCSTSTYFKRKFRVKSVGRIAEEIRDLQHVIQNKRVRFIHDLLTYNREYMGDLCGVLASQFPALRWGCDSRLDTINPPLAEKMVNAGCEFIFLGIEAATPKMQKIIGKRLDLGRIDEVLQSFKNRHINFIFSFVLGIPGEERTDIEAMIELAFKSKSACGDQCTIQMHPLMIELGSRMFPRDTQDLEFNTNYETLETAIPGHWSELFHLMKDYPEIFPSFFKLSKKADEKSVYPGRLAEESGFTLFPFFLQTAMKNSLLFAWRLKSGRDFSRVIFECFENVPPWLRDTGRKGDDKNGIDDLFERILAKTLEWLGPESGHALAFQSIATYEMSVFKVLQNKSPEYFMNIEVFYSESDMSLLAANPELIEEIDAQKRHLLILWDSQTQNVKSVELPIEVAMLVYG